MDYLTTILRDVYLPGVVKIRQTFSRERIWDIRAAVRDAMRESPLPRKIRPGNRVAIGVGSRGITSLDQIVHAIVDELKGLDANPFIVPAMGSHGRATADGQRAILAEYGVTEDAMGCPVIASMDTVCIGTMQDGTPIYFDKCASEADAILPVNRIKVHTDITGDIGSGVMKLMVIGLGKHRGAMAIHRRGLGVLKRSIREASEIIMRRLPVAAGIGIVENAYHKPAILRVLAPESLAQEEMVLFRKSKELMASLPFDQLDFLLVNEFGKDISGSGLDTNIIGRIGIWREPDFPRPVINKIVALHLSPASQGNYVGLGLTDFTHRELVDSLDREALNINMLTAAYVQRGMIPVTLDSEEEAVRAAAYTCWRQPYDAIRMAVIKNTAELEILYVSEALLDEVAARGNIDIVGNAIPIAFDAAHRMQPLDFST